MTEDALKAAVREALECSGIETSYGAFENFTSALARRGVAVAGGEKSGGPAPVPYEQHERETLKLIDERDNAEEALSQAYRFVTGTEPTWSNLFGYKEALEDISNVIDSLGASAPEPHPSESPAPKPARKVVQISAAENYALAVCNDGAILVGSPGSGSDEWRVLPPIPPARR